jgi:hypothetical protein
MSNNQRVANRRLSKQFWRDFGRLVRTARNYAKAELPASAVVQELNEVVNFYDLESIVGGGIPEADESQSCLPFEERALVQEVAK